MAAQDSTMSDIQRELADMEASSSEDSQHGSNVDITRFERYRYSQRNPKRWCEDGQDGRDEGAKGGFKDWLGGMGVTLILWDLFLGLPISYLFTLVIHEVFHYLGYEKTTISPSGITGSRVLFALINTVLVVSWAIQLVAEKKYERIHKLKIENERMRLLCQSLEREKFLRDAEGGNI